MPTSSDGGYKLTVPSTPDHIATVRLFVGAVGRAAGLDDLTIQDAKLAASELATSIVASNLSPVVEAAAAVGRDGMTLRLAPWREGMGVEEDFGALDIVTALFTRTATSDGSVTIEIDATEQDV